MRRVTATAACLLLCCACLLMIAMQAGSPLLYSPRYDAVSADHINPAALDRATGDRSAQVLPLIADLLETPGSLVLNIRGKDFETVARELDEYRQVSRNLDSLIINLDMTEGELAEFRDASRENLYIMTELLNGTGRWDELQTLEIRYRESGDSQMLTSITYEGESLQRKIQDLYRDYLGQEEVMVQTGEKFGLETSGYMQSTRNFREIVDGINRDQEARRDTAIPAATPAGEPYQLTLEIDGERATYWESVVARGRLLASGTGSSGEIDIFIDSEKAATVTAGDDGSFSYAHLVEHDRAGTHTVFAVYSGSVFSGIATFAVETANTSLDLETPVIKEGPTAFQGHLSAGGAPVRNAQVMLLSDGKRVSATFTDSRGRFSADIPIPPGDHRVSASFSGESFPLSPSESREYDISIPLPPGPARGEPGFLADPLRILVLSGSVCASCIVAFLYLRRHKPNPIPAAPVFHLPGSSPGDTGDGTGGPSTPGDAGISPGDALPGAHGGTDLPGDGGDLHSIFANLRLEVSRRLSFLHPRSLTPRELCAICRGSLIGAAVCRFTQTYERAMYGGDGMSADERDQLVLSYTAALEELEGTDH